MTNPHILRAMEEARKTYPDSSKYLAENRDLESITESFNGSNIKNTLKKAAPVVVAALALGASMLAYNGCSLNNPRRQTQIVQSHTHTGSDKNAYMAIAQINRQIEQMDKLQDEEEDKLESIIKNYSSNNRDASRTVTREQRDIQNADKKYFAQVEDIKDDIAKLKNKAIEYSKKAEQERREYMSDLDEVIAENKTRLHDAENKRSRKQLAAGFDTIADVIDITRDVRRTTHRRNADMDDYLRGAKRVVRDVEDIEGMWYKASKLNVRLKNLPNSNDVIKYELKAEESEDKINLLESKLVDLQRTYSPRDNNAIADQSQLQAVYQQDVQMQESIIRGLEAQMNNLANKKAKIILSIDEYSPRQAQQFEKYMK